MIAPYVDPWGPAKATLLAIGLVAALHLLHHAVHYPLREQLRRWAEQRRERRQPVEYLPPTWRPGQRDRQHALLLELRRRRGGRAS